MIKIGKKASTYPMQPLKISPSFSKDPSLSLQTLDIILRSQEYIWILEPYDNIGHGIMLPRLKIIKKHVKQQGK